uniref:E2F_TDP domain-containing protein n=1 Tax=Macrostomum lignano TaxID=282301 RepID=A0A1I8F977_9PLAT
MAELLKAPCRLCITFSSLLFIIINQQQTAAQQQHWSTSQEEEAAAAAWWRLPSCQHVHTRQDKSLCILTERFVQLLKGRPRRGARLERAAAEYLRVGQKRRIYDITNVLEGNRLDLRNGARTACQYLTRHESYYSDGRSSVQYQVHCVRPLRQSPCWRTPDVAEGGDAAGGGGGMRVVPVSGQIDEIIDQERQQQQQHLAAEAAAAAPPLQPIPAIDAAKRWTAGRRQVGDSSQQARDGRQRPSRRNQEFPFVLARRRKSAHPWRSIPTAAAVKMGSALSNIRSQREALADVDAAKISADTGLSHSTVQRLHRRFNQLCRAATKPRASSASLSSIHRGEGKLLSRRQMMSDPELSLNPLGARIVCALYPRGSMPSIAVFQPAHTPAQREAKV